MAGRAKQPTLEDFWQWNRACHVRQVRLQYRSLLEAAKQRGTSVAEEMLAKGYGSWPAFVAACPRFPLTCRPAELSELGSGLVLYFHYLRFMGVTLLAFTLLQLPVLGAYLGADSLAAWEPLLRGHASATGPESRLTPGSLGPRGSDGLLVPVVYALAAWILGLLIVFQHWHLSMIEDDVDSSNTSARHFAVLVEGLPLTATDEGPIRSFFREHAVRCKSDTDIVKVVIGWDVLDFDRKNAKIKRLQSTLTKRPSQDADKLDAIQKELDGLQRDLDVSGEHMTHRVKSSGIAIVVFRHKVDQRACLERWSTWSGRYRYCEPGASACGRCGGGLLSDLVFGKGPPLPLFPVGGHPLYRIKVSPAPDPTDVNWRSLGRSCWEHVTRTAATALAMAALVVASLLLTYTLTRWGDEPAARESGGGLLQVLPSTLVGIINLLMMFAATKFGEGEHHLTRTGMAASQTSMMTICMVLNSAFVLLLTHRDPEDWYKSGGLVADIYYMLILNFFFPPLMFLTDYEFAIKWFRRRWSAPSALRALNAEVAAESSAREVERRTRRLRSIFEPTPMDVPRHHANAEKTFFCCLLYMPLIPLASLIGCVSIFFQYAVDKWMLLRYCRRPEMALNATYARRSMNHVRFAALLGLPVAMEIFLQPSWTSPEALYQAALFALLPFVVLCLAPVRALARRILPKSRYLAWTGAGKRAAVEQDYYEAQYMWPREGKYHKSHFLYARLPEERNPEHLCPSSGDLRADDFGRSYGVRVPGADGEEAWEELEVSGGSLDLASGEILRLTAGLGERRAAPLAERTAEAGRSGGQEAAFGAEAAAPAEGAELRGAAPVWEFEALGGFEPFSTDCQHFLESRFQKWQSGGTQRVKVSTRAIVVSVDFTKMTSMVVGSDRLRRIRRRGMQVLEELCSTDLPSAV